MTSSDGFNVRIATANDYKAVLDINRNVYDGFDYLASMYFYFLHHPDVLLFVAELNGKIVSTRANLHFQVYVSTSNRVLTHYQIRILAFISGPMHADDIAI